MEAKVNWKLEVLSIAILLAPYIVIYLMWEQIPEQVPMHWDIEGNVNRMGSKTELLYLPLMTGGLVYLLMLFAPKIDPKKQLGNMGRKLGKLRLMLVAFMSGIALFLIYNVTQEGMPTVKMVYLLIGALFVALGNMMQAIKPNYFLGIRTPWALNNDDNWRKTHFMGGRIWMAMGILILIASVGVTQVKLVSYLTVGLALLGAFIPYIYSYNLYKKGQ